MDWAAIFDWDGVIVDSSAYHEAGWEALAEEENRELPEDHFKRGFGMRNHTIIPDILGWTDDPDEIERIHNRKGELYRELIRKRGINPLPGVVEFLNTLHSNSIPCAIASSTERKNIICALEVMDMSHEFEAIVSGEDVENGKPDPEVFLTAADKINAPPEKCVVFEDAHVGIDAGKAAGMAVIAVTTTHEPHTLGNADIVVDRLDDISMQQISCISHNP